MLRLRFFQRLGLLAPMLRLHKAVEQWAQVTPVHAVAMPAHRVRTISRAD
jgi:hypothetical protein